MLLNLDRHFPLPTDFLREGHGHRTWSIISSDLPSAWASGRMTTNVYCWLARRGRYSIAEAEDAPGFAYQQRWRPMDCGCDELRPRSPPLHLCLPNLRNGTKSNRSKMSRKTGRPSSYFIPTASFFQDFLLSVKVGQNFTLQFRGVRAQDGIH